MKKHTIKEIKEDGCIPVKFNNSTLYQNMDDEGMDLCCVSGMKRDGIFFVKNYKNKKNWFIAMGDTNNFRYHKSWLIFI